MKIIVIPIVLAAVFLVAGASGSPIDRQYPDDAGLVDVTKAPYGAVPDGKTDCTDAIQRALDEHPSRNAVIYLPAGTYLISETLRWGSGGGGREQKRTVLEGQGIDKTILLLKDDCSGFNSGSGKAMIWTGQKPAQRFRNGIRHLTVDVGKGNSAAIGIQYIANNQGNMRDVLIRDTGGVGRIGLDLGYTNEQGPCLIRDVRIEGFETGISCKTAVDSITIEHVMLDGQRGSGLLNEGQCVSVRGLKSRGASPAVRNVGASSLMTLIDCELAGSGPAAVLNEQGASLLARNLTTSGFSAAISGVPGTNVAEYVSGQALSLFGDPTATLALPIKETPDVVWDDAKDWAGPHQFGGVDDGKTDCSAAVQKAVDSGKTTLYFPRGKGKEKWIINGTVLVRGNVRRIIGVEAVLGGRGGVLKVVDGTSPVVRFEQIDAIYSDLTVVHASKRTLVFSGVSELKYAPESGAGDVFMEDFVTPGFTLVSGQNAWARQLNCERGDTKITNDGASLWILGYKTERHGTLCVTQNGGRTEILGGFAYATADEKTMPMFVNDNSSMSITMGESCFNNKPFRTLVQERRGGQTRTLEKGQVPGRTGGSMIMLYVGANAK